MKLSEIQIEPEAEEELSEEMLQEIVGGLVLQSNEIWAPGSMAYFGPDTRTILLAGEVEENLANSVVGQLLSLAQDGDAPITVYINTTGGDVFQATAIYDTMRLIKPTIITIATGACMSAGLLILQGGDLRLSTPNTRVMYHEPIVEGVAMSMQNISTLDGNYKWALGCMNDILKKRGNISKKTWKKKFKGKTGFYMSPDEAKKLGLIDQVLEYEKKGWEDGSK